MSDTRNKEGTLASARTIRLGDWRIDTGTGVLSNESAEHHLDPIELKVLLHLAADAGQLVTSSDLLETNWPHVVVGDNVVHRVIARLRRALGDSARAPSYIETVTRRGYRLIANVANDVEDRNGSPGDTTIAVLPFANMSEHALGEILGDGIAEDILNDLVKAMSIRVIARTSSFQFKSRNVDVRKIGEVLGVTHVLEGSIRIHGNRVRVTAQLIASADGAHLWSDQFERELGDAFAVQDDITAAVLGALKLYFVPMGRVTTSNPAAYSAFAEGRRIMGLLDYAKGVAAWLRAVSLDPDYPDPHAEIAGSAIGMVFYRMFSISQMQAIIADHQARAMAIDPTNQNARKNEALLAFFVDRDYQRGIDLYHDLLTERPVDGFVLFSYAFVLRAVHRIDLMIELNNWAAVSDPLNPVVFRRQAEDLLWAGRLDDAETATTKCATWGLPVAHYTAMIALLRGDRHRAWEIAHGSPDLWDAEDRRLLFAAELAYDAGDQSAVSSYIDALEPFAGGDRELMPGPGGNRPLRGSIALLKGDVNAALDSYEASIEESFAAIWQAPGLEADYPVPALDRRRYATYYDHPRFKRITEAYGLDAASIARIRVPPLPF